jgi:hypothetical protein
MARSQITEDGVLVSGAGGDRNRRPTVVKYHQIADFLLFKESPELPIAMLRGRANDTVFR